MVIDHICFKCDDMDEKITDLKEHGLLILVPPQPGEAFCNQDIAFLLAIIWDQY
jgi:methylmalonyl-CoA/ethylmalonyl-CoA epimerase